MSEHLLFLTSTRIGDAVLSTGILNHLVQTHPGIRVTVVCGTLSAPLFENVPGLERTIVLTRKRFHAHWIGLWTQTIGRRWDILVDLRVSAMTWLLWVRKRYWLISTSGAEPEHRVVRMGKMFDLYPPPAPHLWLSADNERAGAELINLNTTDKATPIIALGLFANWVGKIWPLDRFITLAERLSAPDGPFPNARFALTGSAAERQGAQPFFDAFEPDRVLDLFGRGSLLDTAAALKHCDLFVGNDSGAMHLAAATGIPTVGLFGPTRDWLYAPYGDRAVAVIPDGFKIHDPWEPRSKRDLPYNMTGLGIDTVMDAIRALLARPDRKDVTDA